MPRKPFIPEGSLAAGGTRPLSLQEKIIARDAEKNGRPAPRFTAGNEDDITSNIESNITSNITEQEEISEEAQEELQPRSQKTAKTRANKPALPTPAEKAVTLADSKADPITLRLPADLNDYLDDLQHTHRKSGIKKQDLVRIAVQLLVIEAENGADIVAMSKGEF